MMMIKRFANWITEHWYKKLKAELEIVRASGNKGRESELLNRIQTATVVSYDDILPGRVQFGSRVTVFSIEEEEEQSFQIVSDDEAKEQTGTLGISTPLAQALIGAQEGNVVRVLLPTNANCDYEVTHVLLPLSR